MLCSGWRSEYTVVSSAAPRWIAISRPRHQAYALVADLVSISESGERNALTPYLLSPRLRDLMEKHHDAFR